MKINFDAVITTLDGKPIKDASKDLTLGMVATSALLSNHEDERPTGQEKAARYSLAVKIHGANSHPLELDLDDAKLIQDLIAKSYTPLVVGQVYGFLNGNTEED